MFCVGRGITVSFMNVTSCLEFPNQQFPTTTCRFNPSHSQQPHRRSTVGIAPAFAKCEDSAQVSTFYLQRNCRYIWRQCLVTSSPTSQSHSLSLLEARGTKQPSHSIIPQSFCSPIVLISTVQLCVGVAHCLTSFFD